MAKFKAGDRVRLSGHPYGCDDEGIYVRKEKDSNCRGKHFVRVSYEDGSPCSTLSFKRRELALVDTPAPAEREQGEPTAEAKFKVGDRVRVNSARTFRTGIEVGDEAVITGREGKYWTLDFTHPTDGTIKQWARDEHLELVTEPDWQPKVGDRVRWKGKDSHYYRRDGEYEIVGGGGERMFHLTDEAGNRERNWSLRGLLENFEPLPVAAEAQGADTLAIQAGRSYRTRDGRKVLVRASTHHKWPFIGDVGSRGGDTYFEADGTAPHLSHCDLVVEWPSDEVAVAPATTTPAAVEHAFKVGDRVRVKEDDREFVVATRNAKGVMSLRSCSGHVGFEWWRDDELLLVDSTIRPGQFATLRVKVTGIHPHGTHANVNIPGLRKPSHGVPLSALTAA